MSSRRSMSTRACAAPIAVALIVGVAWGATKTTSPAKSKELTAQEQVLARLTGARVFVGGVAYTTTLVALDFTRKKNQSPLMRIFVSDGFPGGTAEWFQGRVSGKRFSLTSASGKARIEGTIEPVEVSGTIKLANGQRRLFFTRPAGHGAGIWDLKIDRKRRWRGSTPDGSRLVARQNGDRVNGTIRTPSGERFSVSHVDLSRALRYSKKGGAADTYTLIVTRRGTEIVGRGGNALRSGHASRNLIALDMPNSERTTPGILFGRVAMTTDRLLFDINPAPGGGFLLRAYTSDAEPEPAGDIEWFSDTIPGRSFTLRSKSGNAVIQGTWTGDHISGSLTLPGARPRRYYAKAAGDGAGVYNVTVDANKHYTGTSEEGGVLDFRQSGELVMGTIKTPRGKVVSQLGADLTIAFQYPEAGSKPDSYVAFSAPDGRFLIGRSGNVRGGSPGANIIGLDKKC